jgi:hypothetical protein
MQNATLSFIFKLFIKGFTGVETIIVIMCMCNKGIIGSKKCDNLQECGGTRQQKLGDHFGNKNFDVPISLLSVFACYKVCPASTS